MSKFNSYAKMLDEAFREARDSYATIAGKLEAAKREEQRANSWFEETYVGERESRQARAKAELLAAKEEFKVETRRIWSAYDLKVNQIRAELLSAVNAANRANPDAVDNAGLELLKSGALTVEDYQGLAERYDSNPTMLRLVGKYAEEAAKNADASGDHASRMGYTAVALATKDGFGQIARKFDEIIEVGMYCSGRTHRGDKTVSDPDHVVKMGKCWEEMTGETVGNF